MSRIVLHIDRLVLKGIDRADAAAVAAGVQAELARRLAAAGALPSPELGAWRIQAGRVAVGPARGAELGRAVAQAVASHLGGAEGGRAPSQTGGMSHE